MMRTGVFVVVSSALLFLFGLVGPHLQSCGPEHASRASSLASAGVLITEFYPSAPDGAEYVVITCTAYQTLMDGWTITDGEGTVTLIGGTVLAAGERMALSWSPSSYASAYGVGPDIGLDGTCGFGLFSLSGMFKLADAGDQLAVVSPDGLVSDAVAYGDSACPEVGWVGSSLPVPRAGEVVRRICGPDGVADTDSAADWFHFREYRYGYTTRGPVSALVPAGQLTAFVSPECSLQCVVDEIHAAGESIRLCAYEFSSAGVCAALASALDRGVSVNVLVDGSPAGGMSDDGVACLSALEARGADVFEFTTVQDGSVRHVLALHPKYMVVDSRRSMMLSENFVDSGLPVDRVFGNRGWGVAFTSSFLANHLSALFDDDSRRDRKDVLDWGLDPRYDPRAAIPKEEAAGTFMVTQASFTTSEDAHVAIHVSPDSSPFEPYLCGLIESSSVLLAEQFQADALWESRWTGLVSGSPVISSIGRLVGSGGEASVLLDSSWFNLDRNSASASDLCGAGADARLMMESSPVTTLHNKGLVLDGERTVVSSNNWVYSSFARNRELAAVVTSAEVASYFSSTFMLDWVPDSTPPVADAGPDARAAPGEASVLSAAGSHDDRALVSYEWDVGGDGSVDGEGTVFEVDQAYPGSVTVVLTVVDSWGNRATDSVVVTFGTDGAREDGAGAAAGLAGDVALAAALVVVPAILVMRKTLISRLRDCLPSWRRRGSSRTGMSEGSQRSSPERSGRAIRPPSISRCTTSGRRASSSWRRRA